jgi:hypothetical protein
MAARALSQHGGAVNFNDSGTANAQQGIAALACDIDLMLLG